MSTYDAPKLECGADLLAIVRQVTDGAPAQDAEHQLSCPFCQAALAGVRRVTGSVRELAAEPIVVPPGFARGVLDRLARETDEVALAPAPSGRTTVDDRIVALLAREAAQAVDGVAYASARAEEVQDGLVDVRVRVVARLGDPLQALGAAVRARVVADVERLTGLGVRAVEVVVQDVV